MTIQLHTYRIERSSPASQVWLELEREVKLAAETRRPRIVGRYLQRTAAAVRNLPRALDPDTGLFDLGFDSLAALELQAKIENDCGYRFPPEAMFDYPTLRAISELLLNAIILQTTPETDDRASLGSES